MARTISDLNGEKDVTDDALLEAMELRRVQATTSTISTLSKIGENKTINRM